MPKPKFKQYFEQMFADNKELFLHFKIIHDDYAKNRSKYQADFDREGKLVMDILKEWESRLCGHMEKGANATFSSKLADKFWAEVKKYYPYIDLVGVKIKRLTN